ncbi:MAG: response regulator transcription factor [Proteobacteria bacterium]|nr:MAG: response regulator transcription factor [Pseudomonadota bacterium]
MVALAVDETFLRQKTILIIDDCRFVRTTYKLLLNDSYSLFEAENGREAIKLLKLFVPDLIICDIQMPIMNGIETILKIAEDPVTSKIPLILASSENDLSSIAFRLGIRNICSKDSITTKMLSLIDKIMCG